MHNIPFSIQKLINELSKLPGIGPKTAERLTFYLLRSSDHDVKSLGEAVSNLKDKIKFCSVCFNLADNDPCLICDNPQRDKSVVCVTEEPLDVLALEKTRAFNGVYHVLGGIISPIEGIGPENLRIRELLKRVKENKGKIKEIILATNPSLEGEATAMYIHKLLSPLGLKVTRIARGLPVGGDLDYADEDTLGKAIEGRREY